MIITSDDDEYGDCAAHVFWIIVVVPRARHSFRPFGKMTCVRAVYHESRLSLVSHRTHMWRPLPGLPLLPAAPSTTIVQTRDVPISRAHRRRRQSPQHHYRATPCHTHTTLTRTQFRRRRAISCHHTSVAFNPLRHTIALCTTDDAADRSRPEFSVSKRHADRPPLADSRWSPFSPAEMSKISGIINAFNGTATAEDELKEHFSKVKNHDFTLTCYRYRRAQAAPSRGTSSRPAPAPARARLRCPTRDALPQTPIAATSYRFVLPRILIARRTDLFEPNRLKIKLAAFLALVPCTNTGRTIIAIHSINR